MFRLLRRLFNFFRRPRSQPHPAALPSSPSSGQLNPGSRSLPFDPSVPPRNANRNLSTKSEQIQNLKQVLNVLRAYVVTFGRPSSDLELRAVIGAIVATLPTVQIDNSELEGFASEAIAAFDSLGLDPSLVDVGSQLLAEQVAVWLGEQQVTVSNVVSAYLQHFAPNDAVWASAEVLGLVQTVVATLNDGSLSRSGGRSLVEKVVESFNLPQALSRWVAPEWVAQAQRVASYVSKDDLQMEVRSIAWAYIQQFQAILSPQLIEQIVEKGSLNLSPAEVLAGNFDDFSQMLYYKFQLLASEPVVTKSHLAIAADVRQAVADLQARQPPGIDVTKGVQSGDLEVSSPFKRFGRAKT
jgi:hypothetical protein